MDRPQALHALVGAARFHVAFLQYGPPRGRQVSLLHALARGQEYWSTGVYRDIVPLERIVCTDSFADEKGNVVPASHYGMQEEWPLELLVTVTFENDGGKTIMTLQHAGIPSDTLGDCEAGWNGSFDKLVESLK